MRLTYYGNATHVKIYALFPESRCVYFVNVSKERGDSFDDKTLALDTI